MYRRYSQANGNTISPSQLKQNRIRDLLILVLAGALIASLVIGIPAVSQRSSGRSIYIQRMRAECEDAVRQAAMLSRNAGADSASILARIRSNLYAIRVINSVCNAQQNENLVSDDRVLTLQNTVDQYLTYLTTGMDTGEYQTTLQNALEELQEAVMTLN